MKNAEEPADPVVYKIAPRVAWVRARELGELAPSPDDIRDGYIHLSRAHQLRGTLDRHFSQQRDLVLLAVRVQRLPDGALRWEPSRGGESFPHLHGRLGVAQVEQVFELPLDAQDRHVLPEGL
jgi:uncharacterized protein (DUF952 family)